MDGAKARRARHGRTRATSDSGGAAAARGGGCGSEARLAKKRRCPSSLLPVREDAAARLHMPQRERARARARARRGRLPRPLVRKLRRRSRAAGSRCAARAESRITGMVRRPLLSVVKSLHHPDVPRHHSIRPGSPSSGSAKTVTCQWLRASVRMCHAITRSDLGAHRAAVRGREQPQQLAHTTKRDTRCHRVAYDVTCHHMVPSTADRGLGAW